MVTNVNKQESLSSDGHQCQQKRKFKQWWSPMSTNKKV